MNKWLLAMALALFMLPASAEEKPMPSKPQAEAPAQESPGDQEWVPLEDPGEEPPESSEKAPAQESPGDRQRAPQAEPQSKTSAGDSIGLDRARTEWDYLRTKAEDTRSEIAAAILPDLSRLLRSYPDAEFSSEALQLKSGLHLRLGDYREAIVSYLRLIHEDPGSVTAFKTQKALKDLTEKKAPRKLRAFFTEISQAEDGGEKASRMAALLERLTEPAGEFLYEPLAAEFEDFFGRFGVYPAADKLLLALGRLHTLAGKHEAAVLAYGKIPAVFPDSRLNPKAKRLTADVLADDLKEPDKAATLYQDVISRYPENPEAGLSYERLARIEERSKRYDQAVDIYRKIEKLYPNTEAALLAFQGEARLLQDRLGRPSDAISVYGKLADMFKGDPRARALKEAASIAGSQKDYSTQVELYRRIARDAPETSEAPEALYEAAEICEKRLDDPERAADFYDQLALKYPAHKLAKKAKRRARSLHKGS